MLYNAIYLYKTFGHRKALSVIELAKIKLGQPGLMYNRHVDPERYTEAVGGGGGGLSWSNKMRHAVADYIKLENYICCIDELLPEQKSSSRNNGVCLHISPFILLHMLEVLCYRHVGPRRSENSLDESYGSLFTMVRGC